MYILTRSYPPIFFFLRVITKAHNAVDDIRYTTLSDGVLSAQNLFCFGSERLNRLEQRD